MNPAKRSEPTSIIPNPKLQEQIRQRAHQLYEARGREDGRALDDWLQAEMEILAKGKGAAA